MREEPEVYSHPIFGKKQQKSYNSMQGQKT